jgi:hypothetical protein
MTMTNKDQVCTKFRLKSLPCAYATFIGDRLGQNVPIKRTDYANNLGLRIPANICACANHFAIPAVPNATTVTQWGFECGQV